MNRAETARRSIVVGEQPHLTSLTESITQLQQLVDQIERSAQALPSSIDKGTELISRRLEPLAVALTKLTDATRTALKETVETLKEASTELAEINTTSKTQATDLTSALKKAQTDLAQAQATWHQKIRVPWQALVIPPAIAAVLAVAAMTVLWNWGQPSPDQVRWQGLGHRLEQTYGKMTEKQRQEMLQALGLGKPTS
jgi:ABC-type transporter Mla subunit MlaD